VPFDPANKTSESHRDGRGRERAAHHQGSLQRSLRSHVGSPATAGIVHELEGQGFRVLTVAAGGKDSVKIVGLIALSDPPRADSRALITELQTLGVRMVMVTGDAAITALIVAHEVGLEGPVCPPGALQESVQPGDFGGFRQSSSRGQI